MAKRASAAGKSAGGSAVTDAPVLDRLDAQGNEPDDVQLEDRVAPAPERIAPNLDNDDDETETKVGAPPVFTDPRDALVAGFRARRAAEKTGESKQDADNPDDLVDSIDELEDGDADGDVDGDLIPIIGRDGKPKTAAPAKAESKAKAETTTAPEDDIPDDRPVTMIVDGAKVSMTMGEMRARGQQLLAADRRLNDAKRILDEAKTLRDSAATETAPERANQRETAPQERQDRVIVDPAKIKAAIPKIQLGDDDEAAKALGDVIADAVQAELAKRGNTKAANVDVPAEVDQHLAEREAKAEVNSALRTISETYADIVNDDDYAPAVYTRAHKEVVGRLRAIGVPEQDLRLPAEQVFLGYARLRQDPRFRSKLEPIEDAFVSASESVREKFGLPERQADTPRIPSRASQQQSRVVRTDEDRSGRKGKVSVQPRSGSLRADYSGNGVAPKRTPPADVVQQMAESRGQFVGRRQ